MNRQEQQVVSTKRRGEPCDPPGKLGMQHRRRTAPDRLRRREAQRDRRPVRLLPVQNGMLEAWVDLQGVD